MGLVHSEMLEEVHHVAGESPDDALWVSLPPCVEGDGREVAREGRDLLEEPSPSKAEAVDQDECRTRAPDVVIYAGVLGGHYRHVSTSRLAA